MRLRSVTVIVVSILLVAIASVAYAFGGIAHLLRLDRSAPGVPPIAIGTAWDCPSGHGVKAYAKDRLYYPPSYPAPPPYESRPAWCFRTASEAASQSYLLAPPPPGSVMFKGVYLISAKHRVHDQCLQAARSTGLSFPCPTLLPAVEADQICSGSTGCVAGGRFIQYALEFTTPPDFPGAFVNPRGLGSNDGSSGLVLIFVDANDVRPGDGVNAPVCQRIGAGPLTMGVPSGWETCIPHGQSRVQLTWLLGRTTYHVIPREQSDSARTLAELIASHLEVVGP